MTRKLSRQSLRRHKLSRKKMIKKSFKSFKSPQKVQWTTFATTGKFANSTRKNHQWQRYGAKITKRKTSRQSLSGHKFSRKRWILCPSWWFATTMKLACITRKIRDVARTMSNTYTCNYKESCLQYSKIRDVAPKPTKVEQTKRAANQ